MKGEDRDGDLLEYIWESIQRIEEYRREGSRPMAQDAVLRRLETLADAAGRWSSWPAGSWIGAICPRSVGIARI